MRERRLESAKLVAQRAENEASAEVLRLCQHEQALVRVGEEYVDVAPKREYDLSYAPLSSSNHGDWPTVRDDDTLLCAEPLHRNHRVGAFRPPFRTIEMSFPLSAFELARDGITQVFAHYGCDIRGSFGATEVALKGAAYADQPE